MFRATMCPSSEEITVSMTVRFARRKPDIHPHRVTNTKCRNDTVISPDDGHIVVRNMCRKEINILKKLCNNLTLFTRLKRFYLLKCNTTITTLNATAFQSTIRKRMVVGSSKVFNGRRASLNFAA